MNEKVSFNLGEVLFTKEECEFIKKGIDNSPAGTSSDDMHRRYEEFLILDDEILNLIFEKIKDYCLTDNIKFNNKATSVFFAIERNGIKINKKQFNKYFDINYEHFNIKNDTIYTQYNLYTTTGRPSNSFNSVNFAALAKDNGCRKSFIPNNDKFIEIDISAYHPTLAAKLIGYDFGDETPYEYFAREANIEVNEAKILMFKQLYGGIYNEYKYIDFFLLKT